MEGLSGQGQFTLLGVGAKSKKGGSVSSKGFPPLIPTSAVPSRPMGGHRAGNPAGWYLHSREAYQWKGFIFSC